MTNFWWIIGGIVLGAAGLLGWVFIWEARNRDHTHGSHWKGG